MQNPLQSPYKPLDYPLPFDQRLNQNSHIGNLYSCLTNLVTPTTSGCSPETPRTIKAGVYAYQPPGSQSQKDCITRPRVGSLSRPAILSWVNHTQERIPSIRWGMGLREPRNHQVTVVPQARLPPISKALGSTLCARAFGWQAHRTGLALRMRRRAWCEWRW